MQEVVEPVVALAAQLVEVGRLEARRLEGVHRRRGRRLRVRGVVRGPRGGRLSLEEGAHVALPRGAVRDREGAAQLVGGAPAGTPHALVDVGGLARVEHEDLAEADVQVLERRLGQAQARELLVDGGGRLRLRRRSSQTAGA